MEIDLDKICKPSPQIAVVTYNRLLNSHCINMRWVHYRVTQAIFSDRLPINYAFVLTDRTVQLPKGNQKTMST